MTDGLSPEDQACQVLAIQAVETEHAQFLRQTHQELREMPWDWRSMDFRVWQVTKREANRSRGQISGHYVS